MSSTGFTNNAALCIAHGEDVNTPLVATADWGYVRLRQVVDNLVINAMQAMPQGGTLTITTGERVAGPAEGALPIGEAVRLLRGLGIQHLVPPPPPPQETLPRWRRVVEGVRHSKSRDAGVISRRLRGSEKKPSALSVTSMFCMKSWLTSPSRCSIRSVSMRVAPSAHGYKSLGTGSPNITRAQHCRAEFFAQALIQRLAMTLVGLTQGLFMNSGWQLIVMVLKT